jgi:regulator of protease activity HflC (stomatin/prohibitin superfamily)
MASSNHPRRSPDDPQRDEPEDTGSLDPMEIEEPRREASARFVVDKVESSSVQMRAAMDPANQSLGEALRLSYRVLQVAILALVVTFLFSGFQSVREGSTGVKTMFGRIVEGADGAQLSPGLTPFWPYPIGELLVFDQKRPVKLDREFQPRETPNAATKEQQVDQAGDNRELIAERDGWVMTADGDIAHVSLIAEYTITDAVEFVTTLDPEQVDRLVRNALMRGTVQAASKFTLDELTQSSQAPSSEVQLRTQEVLDQLRTGITVGSVTFVDRSPPRFVDSKFREVQAKRESAKTVVEQARQRVTSTLTGVAGSTAFEEITTLIREYDAALVRNDTAGADALFEKIGARFEAPDVSGEVSRLIQQARGESALRIASLQKEYTRLEGLAPAFRENPRQLVRQLWLDAVRTVLGGKEIEVITPPDALSQLVVKVKSSQDIMQLRRAMALARKKAEQQAQQLGDFFMRGSQISIGQSSGRLERDASRGKGRDDIHSGGPGG